MITENLEERILLEPARINGKACNRLKIISGFTDIERISKHLIQLFDGRNIEFVTNIRVELILGMTKGAGLTEKKHKNICNLQNRLNSMPGMPKIRCYYIIQGKQVHSKVYIWCKADKPVVAFCGSANYSMNAFFKRRECMELCDAASALKYYKELTKDTIDSMNADVSEKMMFVDIKDLEEDIDDNNLECLDWKKYRRKVPVDTIKVSLLKADGKDTGYGSGVNWGIRPNKTKRNPNQAYIPYNKRDREKGFFPEKGNENNYPIFKVVTKNYGAFYMRRAQEGGKALQTPESNAILGEWLRKELGVADGTYITKEMLERHGGTYVVFKKYDDGIYTLDYPEEK